jgi:hypothetical protein
MANNKVQLSDGTVLLDLTGDTVTPETLLSGVTAHNAAGEPIVGTVVGIKLTGIAITTPPTKTAYKAGETFDPAGMVVIATYSNGAKLMNPSYTFAPAGALTASDTAITITYTEGGVTKTATQAITVHAIYGVSWDGSSSPQLTRTDASANFPDPVAYMAGISNYGSPFDNIMPWSGMEIVDDATCGKLVKIPKYWYRWTKTGNQMKLQISDAAQTGFLVSPAHANRGDGKGERDYVYVGRYHCASTYKSTSGVKPVGNITRATARSSIHALGSDVWQYDFAMYWTIMMLYLVEYADWNSQAKIGYGCGNNSGTENMGATDAMTYHTGTTAASRTTYAAGIQYRHIEGLWSNVFDWCDGIYFSGANVYCIKNPASFSDTSGGTNIGTRPTSSNWISAWSIPSVSGFEYALYPSAVAGSENTYVCDYCLYSASGVVLYVGSSYSQYQNHGAFYLNGNNAASYASANVGCRLQKLF